MTPIVIEEGGMLVCNAQLLFEFLRQMGLPEEVMKQVQSKAQPRIKKSRPGHGPEGQIGTYFEASYGKST